MKGLLLLVTLFASATALADATELERGRELYLTAGGYGCHVCHGLVAHGAGQAGGNIRGASLDDLDASFIENAPMQPLDTVLDDSQRNAIAAYLTSLGQVPLLNIHFDKDRWLYEAEAFESGQVVEIVAYNGSFSEQTLTLSDLGLDDLIVAPLDTITLRWQAQSNTIKLRNAEPMPSKP